ncbi:MAG: exodeoxyribonuclease VII large subunit, partial [Ilumatobacteraceae bacterium]
DAVNASLRRQFGDGVWVRGEIQGYGEKGGHAYFRLVESGDERKAVLDVSFFANVRMRIRPILQKHRLRLGDGMKVRILGVLDYYAANGRLSLKMSGIDPRYTLGEMAVQRDEVVRQLVAKGLYDANRGHALARVPLRIGLVTSRDSAAWHDFMHELMMSGHGFGVRVIDVRVQGELATEMITNAIRQLSRRNDIDVIVVIRGGGSRTELAIFDDEGIAAAIAAAPVPIFTGLGHETDRSVADEVAHTAFKTPTACAVALIERVLSFSGIAEQAWAAIESRAAGHVDRASVGLLDTARRIEQRTVGAVGRAEQRLLDRSHRSALLAARALVRADDALDKARDGVGRRPLQVAAHELQTLAQIESRVRLLDPVQAMARGWSLARTAEGRIVRSSTELAAGDEIVTTFADGVAHSRVETIIANPSNSTP